MRGRKSSPVVGLDASRFDPASYISVQGFPETCEDHAKSRSGCMTYNLLLIEWPTEPKHLKPQGAMPHGQPRRYSAISKLSPKLRVAAKRQTHLLLQRLSFAYAHVRPCWKGDTRKSQEIRPLPCQSIRRGHTSQAKQSCSGGDCHEMGKTSHEVPDPEMPTASFVTSRKSLGTDNIGGDQRGVPNTALTIPKRKGTSFDGNQKKGAVSCTKP